MSRNIRTEGVALKAGRVGEIHKSVTFLTPELGVVEAIAHGVYKGKGKLASGTDPFAESVVYLYFEPVKRSYKVVDIEVQRLHEGVRSNLERFYIASLWAEVILRSHGGGEGHDRLYALLTEALAELDRHADPRRVQAQFLWRYIAHAGFLPDMEACGACGRPFDEQAVVFHRREAGDFVCSTCAGDDVKQRNNAELSAGARRYLARSGSIGFTEALRLDVAAESKTKLLRILYTYLEDIVEAPLRTLEAGVL